MSVVRAFESTSTCFMVLLPVCVLRFWDVDQPDNWAFKKNGEDCGQFHATDVRIRRRWNDADCNVSYNYICEMGI